MSQACTQCETAFEVTDVGKYPEFKTVGGGVLMLHFLRSFTILLTVTVHVMFFYGTNS